jgi:hypothetical protein
MATEELMADLAGWVNSGVIVRPGTLNQPGSGRTFIVSGLGRGGTTMVASALRDAGMPMGVVFHEAAVEDLDVFVALRQRDRTVLDTLIAKRNSQHVDWGFKLPNIHGLLQYRELARFRNPHLILIFRDPVAITQRAALSDYKDPLPELLDVSSSIHNLLQVFSNTTCPALLLSYEKALIFPDIFVDSLVNFCGLPRDAATRLRRQVTPNSKMYADETTVKMMGYLESLHGNILTGWCTYINVTDTNNIDPIMLDFFLNDTKFATSLAQRHRPDLVQAGYGNGNSGFEIDLTAITLGPEDRLHVRPSQRPLFKLRNSGRTVAEYRQGNIQ